MPSDALELHPRQRRLLVPLYAAVALFAFAAGLSSPGPLKFGLNLAQWTLGCLGGAWLCASALPRFGDGDKVRLRWFTAALGAYALGQLLWDLQAVSGRGV